MPSLRSSLYKALIVKDSASKILLAPLKDNHKKVCATEKIFDGSFIKVALEKEISECIFVHAGLSRLKNFQNAGDSYLFLLSQLKSFFKTVLAPGFTPSFRHSGIYHVNFSIPEYGAWSRLFLKDADFRTNDAIHSILGIGDEFDFSKCNHQDSFGKDSCFYELVKNNVLIANIATDDFVCTLIHCLEKINNTSYILEDLVEGEVYTNNTNHFHVTQSNYKPCFRYIWDRKKILSDCKKAGILHDYSCHGIILYFFKAGDFFDFISGKMKADRFYLLKWGGLL